ncbi:hypothetical protein [Enterovirga sp. CN4-39]|uniref:hypothetical protein n=1 Tax=Enterovirga sp. CN4-39 TaxID=3400910 RepID=UPI003C064828
MSRDIERRVIRLERDRHTAAPDMILSDSPEIPDDALENWRHYVASGRANVSGRVLCFHSPELTEEEWLASAALPG